MSLRDQWILQVEGGALVVTRTAVEGTSLMATCSGVKAREELGFVPHVGLDDGMAAVRQRALQERLL